MTMTTDYNARYLYGTHRKYSIVVKISNSSRSNWWQKRDRTFYRFAFLNIKHWVNLVPLPTIHADTFKTISNSVYWTVMKMFIIYIYFGTYTRIFHVYIFTQWANGACAYYIHIHNTHIFNICIEYLVGTCALCARTHK